MLVDFFFQQVSIIFMNIDKAISIKVQASEYVDYKELNHFQGNLKSITKEKFDDLKQSLIKSGLPLAIHVWIDDKGKKWTLDGHHRILAFKALEDEGYFIPPIPINIVIAKTKKEAAQILLVSNARYAQITDESLSDFMIDMDLQMPDLEFIDIPELKNFVQDFDESEFNPNDSEDEKKHKTCPHCGEIL